MGFAGIDIGTDLPTLLRALVAVLPEDQSTMLRIGMTNPPYILKHLNSIAAILDHPCVYSFLHVPVQSGSDNVLQVNIPSLSFPWNVSTFLKCLSIIVLPVCRRNLSSCSSNFCAVTCFASLNYRYSTFLVSHLSIFYVLAT